MVTLCQTGGEKMTNPKINKEKKDEVKLNTLRGKYFFLTIPHFDQLEETYQLLELKSKELLIDKIAVVLETHTADVNKGKHIHVFVSFTKRRCISLKFFDFLGKHGKLENIRSIEAVLQYMNKENVCKANFDVWRSLLENARTFSSTIVYMISNLGYDPVEVLEKYSQQLAGRPWKSAIELGFQSQQAKLASDAKPKFRMRAITRKIIESRLSTEELAIFDSDHQFAVFVDYVNKILRYGNQQLHKQCCLSIVGKPSIGKSTVINELKKFFHTYVFPLDGWHSQYRNYVYDIVLWNEWDIKLLSKSNLLLFTEGEIVDLKVKYTKAVKQDRPMIIFTANETWQQQVAKRYGNDKIYHDLMLEALAVRIVELDFGLTKIWFLTKLFVATVEDITQPSLVC